MSGGRVLCTPRALILTRLKVLVGNGHMTANGIPTSRVLVDAPSPSRLSGSAVDPIPVRICRGRRWRHAPRHSRPPVIRAASAGRGIELIAEPSRDEWAWPTRYFIVNPFQGADLRLSGGLSPFHGAGAQVDTTPKWRDGVAAKPFVLPFRLRNSPLKRE